MLITISSILDAQAVLSSAVLAVENFIDNSDVWTKLTIDLLSLGLGCAIGNKIIRLVCKAINFLNE